MDLQTAYYITSIVFMVLMSILVITLFIALLVIRSKVNKASKKINQRIAQAKFLTSKFGLGLNVFGRFARK